MKYIYRQRPFSYDSDWLDAFRAAGVECIEESPDMALDDCTILSHSILGSDIVLMDYTIKKLRERSGRLVIFMGNEWKWFTEKSVIVRKLRADLAVTQMPLATAQSVYGEIPLLELPHAMSDYHRPLRCRYERTFDIGVRGMKYKAEKLGDDDRANICSEDIWKGLKTDLLYGFMLKRTDWRRALNDWRAMPSCEAGPLGAKAISSRHFDAIACGTTLVMYQGAFNGILRPHDHYIVLNRDHSNLHEVQEMLIDGIGQKTADTALEHCMRGHTLNDRVQTLLGALA